MLFAKAYELWNNHTQVVPDTGQVPLESCFAEKRPSKGWLDGLLAKTLLVAWYSSVIGIHTIDLLIMYKNYIYNNYRKCFYAPD